MEIITKAFFDLLFHDDTAPIFFANILSIEIIHFYNLLKEEIIWDWTNRQSAKKKIGREKYNIILEIKITNGFAELNRRERSEFDINYVEYYNFQIFSKKQRMIIKIFIE